MGDSFDGKVLRRLAENISSLAPPQDATQPSRTNGVCIPQRGDNARHLNLATFMRLDGTYIPVKAALEGDYTGLIGHNVPAFGLNIGYTINVRFEWPGYAPRDFQLRTRDWQTPPKIISLSKLATEVSKIVRQFLEGMETQNVAPQHREWKAGPDGIQLKDLRLATLEQVTTGSYRPRLFWKP